MRYAWSRFVVILLLFEGVIFALNYNFGSSGLRTLRNLKHVKATLHNDIDKLKVENSLLQDEIDEWSSSLFLQEKYAREKLQMQKEHEKIYFR